MKIPELLAPVGSIDQLKIAINAGASSIYISGKDYGARKFAENFTLKQIEEVVDISHLHNVKVYVTVNTLIKEEELKNVLNYLTQLYEIGVDAVLVQDLGLIEIINKYIPNLSIHGSTQMNLENKMKIDYIAKKGLERIVLPREMRAEEIKNIKTSMETEIFAHGSLCYSYSGQCLMSSLNGGRSGNRGECAQPCREKYKLSSTNKEKYYLSPKDLSLFNYLDEIIQLDIDCIKIEGRMRNKQYLAIVISQYRKALNKLKNKKNIETEDLNLVFNREFTAGQFKKQFSRTKQPGHVGLYLGKIIKTKGNKIAIKLEDNLKTIPQKGDGILIFKENNKYGFEISQNPLVTTLNNFNKNKIKPLKDFNRENRILILKKVKENKKSNFNMNNALVYLNKRNMLSKKVDEIENNFKSYKKSNLSLTFIIKNNYPILKGEINGLKAEVKGKKVQEPIKRATNRENIKKQLIKLGNYPFILNKVNINYNNDKFIPISEINELRRNLLKKLEKKIINSYKNKKITPKYKKKKFHHKKRKSNLSFYTNNLNLLPLIHNVKRVYLEIPTKDNFIYNYGKPNINVNYMITFMEKAIKLAENKDYTLIWKWPDIAHDKLLKILQQVKGILNKKNIHIDIMSPNFNAKYGPYSLNITNSETIKSLNEYKLLTLSLELKKEDYDNIIKYVPEPSKLEILVQGNNELMKTRNKLLNIKESKKINSQNETFITNKNGEKLKIKENLSNEELIILNSKELSLIEEIPFLQSIGYSNFSIDGRWKNRSYLDMINIYNSAINGEINLKKLNKISNKNSKFNF